MDFNLLHNITLKNKNLRFKGIIYAVDIHRQAVRLSKLLVTKIETMCCCLIITGVIGLSFSLFRIFQIVSSKENLKENLMPFLVTICIITYMFVANYVCQNVTDHNNHIYITAYDVQWYMAPLHIQKLILFLLQNGTKDLPLRVGVLFTGSLEGFATLVKASVSYFTFIYSTR
ncbi:uncharacterized protein LOC118648408 [Monomorium pharaonis]|uniref:uncharacterized protein LOC118648408 n=1 Tax=Monomorium pharaonis TaxID=307658 RepID=UPI001747A72A|nr:uncharacterized protein LOC118648408 [Monomorium pharaonis]